MATVDLARVERALEVLEREHPGAQLLVNDPWSIYYFTGFYAQTYERFSGLLLATGQRPVIFDNVLYPIDSCENADVVEFSDTDDVADVISSRVDASRPRGIDGAISSSFLMPLQERRAASASPRRSSSASLPSRTRGRAARATPSTPSSALGPMRQTRTTPPGGTGVRIEDLVLMGEGGPEILNSYTHEPRRLDV